MSAPAAISGEFTTIKHVPSRKVYQLVIEVAEEAAQHAFDTLGMPGHGGHIALARLVEKITPENRHAEFPKGERPPFTEKPYATQAALRCQEPSFQMFLIETGRMPECRVGAEGVDNAADTVRLLCNVKSRADIGKGPNDRSANDSGFKWRALDAEYYAWQRGHR